MKRKKMERVADPLDVIRDTTAQSWTNSDSRVIIREREVLLFALHAAEDHREALAQSMREVEGKQARIKARIDGLTRVLNARQSTHS